ncbi:MAG TPA: LysR family transcriptional regulator [Ideonella sp.]|nr:LysR family transcriptional regulator [Ideonella sp.]
MHINDLNLNLLRVFDSVYRNRNVSRSAEELGLSQPATSQALTRLRLLLKDPLFMRAQGGVQPTPKADKLAQAVRLAISTVEAALNEAELFDPLRSQKTFRLHLSDIGEARFLPSLMAALSRSAPGLRIQSFPLPHGEIAAALDSGRLDLAIGFLPAVNDTQTVELVRDRYIVLLREGHPLVARRRARSIALADLSRLDYVAVRSHSETLRILQLLRLEDRIRLTASHFLALPEIVRSTDLGVVMPLDIARGFAEAGGYTVIEPRLPLRDFGVALHWSRRFQSDPAHEWMRELVIRLFKALPGGARRA